MVDCQLFCSVEFKAQRKSSPSDHALMFNRPLEIASIPWLKNSIANDASPLKPSPIPPEWPDRALADCARCACSGCGFCQCSSDHSGDSSRETCSPWCELKYHRSHCSWCSCKGCEFCSEGVQCDSFLPDDSSVEKVMR